MSCPDEAQFVELLDGRLSLEQDAALHGHINDCDSCQTLLAELVVSNDSVSGARVIGPYRLDAEIGQGGMGVVYRAVDRRRGRPVALKLVMPFLDGNEHAAERFRREARAASALDHPNVGVVLEIGEHEGRLYIAMPLYDGETLKQRIARGPLAIDEAVGLLRQMASALEAAHAAGIIHRDVKPGNVIVTTSGQVKLLDFGLAKHSTGVDESLTESGELVGTLAYVAPEQHRNAPLDARADLWAFGVVAYQLVTGVLPFAPETQLALIQSVMGDDPIPPRRRSPNVPADLEIIILKCLEKDPERRYPSAAALARDLDRFVSHDPIEARRASLGYRLAKRIRKHRVLAVAALLVFSTALFAAAVFVKGRRDLRSRVQRAQQLGQSVQELRNVLRNAHLLPLHDTAPERKKMRARLNDLEAQLPMLDPETRGLSEYALGSGYMALNDRTLAESHLERAWELGERGPDVAFSLGQAVSAVYRQQMEQAQAIVSPDERKRRESELKVQFHDRATELIRSANGATGTSPEYIASVVAWNEHDYATALKESTAAFKAEPTLYEAGLVQAESLGRLAADTWSHGDVTHAMELFAQEREVFQRVLEIARSDDEAYRQRADYLIEQFTLLVERKDNAPLVAEIVAACEGARQANSDNQRWMALEAETYLQVGTRQTGRDSYSSLKKATEIADLAVAADPHSLPVQTIHADAWSTLAEWQSLHGEDPAVAIENAILGYQTASKLGPTTDFYNNLALTYKLRGYDARRRGVGVSATVALGMECTNKATQLDPAYRWSSTTAARLQLLLAEDTLERGKDPSAAVNEALRFSAHSFELDPAASDSLAIDGFARLVLARWTRSGGGDAATLIAGALRSCTKAAELDARDSAAQLCLAAALTLSAQSDAAASLVQANKHADQVVELDPSVSDGHYALGRIALVDACRHIAHHESPLPALTTAESEASRAAQLNPIDPTALVLRASVSAVTAQPAQIHQALDWINAALAINPHLASAYAARAVLLRESSHDPEIAKQVNEAAASATTANSRRYPPERPLTACGLAGD